MGPNHTTHPTCVNESGEQTDEWYEVGVDKSYGIFVHDNIAVPPFRDNPHSYFLCPLKQCSLHY